NHALTSIHDKDHYVGVLNRLQRLDHGELFDRFEDLAATAYACGVDQRVFFVATFEGNIDTVSGGSSLIINNDPLFPEHAVDQRRFADIGPTDDGNLDAILLARSRYPLWLLPFGNNLIAGCLAFLILRLLGIVLGERTQRLF